MPYTFNTTVMYNKSHLTVHWDAATRDVVMEWKSYAPSSAFREGLDKGLETVIEKKTHRWLADLRKLGVLSPEDQKWSNEDWFPRAIEGGISRMALVVPESVLANIGVRNIMSQVDEKKIVTQYFDSVDDARGWLHKG